VANLLYLSRDSVVFSDKFDSSRGTIYKETDIIPTELFFTKILTTTDLIFQESERGRLLTSITDYNTRISLPPLAPISRPFIPNYSASGSLQNEDFINLLLIDKPPIRTGFFQFTIPSKSISFVGFVTRLSLYDHWNWEQYFDGYAYVKQVGELGYGIEISNNLLYTASYSSAENRYIYTPTALYNTLISLTGEEEIISSASTVDPNTYLNPVQGDIVASGNSLPIDLFYIAPADALRYIASYEDLIEQFGTDFTKGQQHYAQFARRITFDPISYLNKYPDLRDLYGYDTYAATEHYISVGYAEGREPAGGSSFNSLSGGLYDERYGGFGLSEQSFIWSNGPTLANDAKRLTYKFNNIEYYLNGEVSLTKTNTYLRRQ